ncbi:MAG TPA: hypothetical protein VMZ91_03580 [Candidatus Paceibacterota bacterium]|nr:hypothetical protein [Candidatus Paceibacterota bacterium]
MDKLTQEQKIIIHKGLKMLSDYYEKLEMHKEDHEVLDIMNEIIPPDTSKVAHNDDIVCYCDECVNA